MPALVAATIALVLITLPHALEDFHYGDLSRLGIALPAGVAILASAYALQLIGIILTWRGRRSGPALLGVMGAVWCIGAIAIHGHDLLFAGPDYRHGFVSKALEVLIIALGAICALLGALSVRSASTRTATPR
jgi:hypothetical protein